MVERQANPDHVRLSLPSIIASRETTVKFDWTSKSRKRVLCDVQRRLGNVDANVASDAGVTERCGREGRSAAGEMANTKPSFASVQENLVERVIDLLMPEVVGGHHLLVRRRRKQFLIGRWLMF